MLGCSTKAGVFTAKQFHKKGYRVEVLDWKELPYRRSRFISKFTLASSPEADLIGFEGELLSYLAKQKVNYLFPVHDAALEIVRHVLQHLPGHIVVLGRVGARLGA